MPKNKYKKIAWAYDFLDLPFEYLRYQSIRKKILSDLNGLILEAGVGTGRNMAFYPNNCIVIGIDNSRDMLKLSKKRAAKTSVTVHLAQIDIQSCALKDNSFDYIISTFVFCTLKKNQQILALKELGRILKPNSQLRIMDYTYSKNLIRLIIMKFWSPWVNFAFGAKFQRSVDNTVIEASGLSHVSTDFVYKDMIKITVLKK